MVDVIVPLLRRMLSPDTAALAAAERDLRELEGRTVDFAVHLLEVIGTYPPGEADRANVCQAAAIVLKQVLRRRWPIGPEGIPGEVKARVLELLAPAMLYVVGDIAVVARQLSECFWPIFADPGFAEATLLDILVRLDEAWRAQQQPPTAIHALLRVFKIAIRTQYASMADDDDSDDDDGAGAAAVSAASEGMAVVIQRGVGLLFQMLTLALDRSDHHVAKLVVRVLMIAAEHKTTVGAVFVYWIDPACIGVVLGTIAAPVDASGAPTTVAWQWKLKARAVLMWMYMAIHFQGLDLPPEQVKALDESYISMLDAALGHIDAREGVPSGDALDEVAFSGFVCAVCQCITMNALDRPALAADFFGPHRVERLLTQTLLKLMCVGQYDHELLVAEPAEYHRRTEEEFEMVMFEHLLLVCPHGHEFANECDICEMTQLELFEEKSTARSAAMSAIEKLSSVDGCAEPYLSYIGQTLGSTPGTDPDAVSLRCGLFKAFAAVAQLAPRHDAALKALVIDILGRHVLTELKEPASHPIAVHTRCACCAVAERYLSFLLSEGHADLTLALIGAMLTLVGDADECVRVHAIEALRSAVRTHALLQPLLDHHAPALLDAAYGLYVPSEPIGENTADILQLLTLFMFKFFGRLGDVADDAMRAEVPPAKLASHIAESHRAILDMLSVRFDVVVAALSDDSRGGGDVDLEMLLCRHIEAAHAVCMSAPTAPDVESATRTVHPALEETLLALTLKMLCPNVVHIVAKYHVIADMIDCLSMLPPQNVRVQNALVEPLLRLVSLNMSGRELLLHPLATILHHAGSRFLVGPLGGALAVMVDQSLRSTSHIFLCHLADLVRSIAIVSGDNAETRGLRQHLVEQLALQLLAVSGVAPATMPEAQYPVRIASALCAMLYVDPEATWVTLRTPVRRGDAQDDVTGVMLLLHFGLARGFPALSSKRQLDVTIMLLGLGRVTWIEAHRGVLVHELWSSCFHLLAKFHRYGDEKDEEEDDDYLYDPDDAIAEEESCEIVESEVFSVMTEDPHVRLREAAVQLCAMGPDFEAQLRELANEELWSLLMSDS